MGAKGQRCLFMDFKLRGLVVLLGITLFEQQPQDLGCSAPGR